MCDVMPTIPEDANTQVGREPQLNGEGGNVEDLLFSMLDERDRLILGLKEAREELQAVQLRLREVEKERGTLQSQLSGTVPADILACTQELSTTKEQLSQRTEEVLELKAERSNMRLLLEHLECLVSRHERSLRMTVVKRHNLASTTIPGGDEYDGNASGSSSGISSEVEVLKALKSLFEHHKALDEKVRERLNSAIARASQLELELAELKSHYPDMEGASTSTHTSQRRSVKVDASTITDFPQFQELTSLSQMPFGGKGSQNYSYDNSENLHRRITELMEHSSEVEQKLVVSSRELARASSQINQLHAELIESEKKRTEQEEKVAALDQRCLSAQREIANIQNQADKLRTELAGKVMQLKQAEEKVARLQVSPERVEPSNKDDGQNSQVKKPEPQEGDCNFASLSQFQQQIAEQKSQLSNLSIQLSNAQDNIKELTERLEDDKSELIRAHEREKLIEEHNERLSSTVDTLLLEANERLQSHLSERMTALQQKRDLISEVERLRVALEEAICDREALAKVITHLRRRLSEKTDCALHHSSAIACQKSPTDEMNNLDTIDALLAVDPSGRLICDNTVSASGAPVVYSGHPSLMSPPIKTSPFNISSTAFNCDQPGPVISKFNDLMNRTGNREYANISWSGGYNSLPHNYSQSQPPPLLPMPEVNTSYSCTLHKEIGNQHQQSPQALATLIQQQLEVINDEIKMILEEKESTDLRANELRSRVSGYTRGGNRDAGIAHLPPTLETADARAQTGCWRPPTLPLKSVNYKSDICTSNSLPRQTPSMDQTADLVYKKGAYSTLPPFMPQLWSHQHGYDAEMPQSIAKAQSQMARFPPNSKWKPKDHTETANVYPPTDTRRGPHEMSRFTNRPDEVYWSPQEAHIHRNTRLPSSTPETSASDYNLETCGRRLPSARHRMTEHEDENILASQLDHTRQWSGENPSRSLSQNTLSEAEVNINRYAMRSAQKKKVWQKGEDLIEKTLRENVPFAMWNTATVVAWLEHWVGMPAWYVAACRANITSGGMLASFSDQEVQRELGISNPLHRMKLRVAIQEMIAFTNTDLSDSAHRTGTPSVDLPLLLTNLNHEWVGNVWLTSLGLNQYRRQFMECLVDGRMLENLTRRDLRVHLKVVDAFHRISIQCGIALLKRFNYDVEAIEKRRLACLNKDTDLIFWTNERLTSWLSSIDVINSNMISLDQSGLHGAVIALDADMDTPALAMLLQIPKSNIDSRELLEYHLFELIKPYRSLRLFYINLDNPAFLSDDKGKNNNHPRGEEERKEEGALQEGPRGYKAGLSLAPTTESSQSVAITSTNKISQPSTNPAKGQML